jgi:hypothetical protein
MCHAKHCTQYTVLHFALQCNKKPDEQAAAASLWRAIDLRFEKRLSVWPRRLVRHGPALAHARHIRTQACLSRRDQMIVARQFIAWNVFKKATRPGGTV